MNETSQTTSCGANGSEVEPADVRPLEDDHARVVANLRVQLPVADVERDDPRGPALQEDVGEPARRRADVEAVEARDVDPERVEGVRQLVTCARDVRRRPLDLEPASSSTCSPAFV